MTYNQVKRKINMALNKASYDESLSELKRLIDLDFLYINEDRGYIAIDVNSDAYREDSRDQTFIFTAEGNDEDDGDFWLSHYMAWDGEYGYSHGFDLNGALMNAQEVALRLFDKYQ